MDLSIVLDKLFLDDTITGMDNKQEIKDKIQNHINTNYEGSLRFMKDKVTIKLLGGEILQEIKSITDHKLHNPMPLLLYCFLNDITEQPKCVCGNDTKYDKVRKRFGFFCSTKCRYENNEEETAKRVNTCLEKYGTKTYMVSEEGLERNKQIMIEKYGVDNYGKTEEFKELRKNWK